MVLKYNILNCHDARKISLARVYFNLECVNTRADEKDGRSVLMCEDGVLGQ